MERKSTETEVLSTSEDSFLEWHDQEARQRTKANKRLRFWTRCNILFAILNLGLVVLLFISWRCLTQDHSVQLLSHDFTKPAIEMEIRSFDDTFGDDYGSKYRGDPRPELDEAWASLMRGYNLRVPKSVPLEPAIGNRSLVTMPDDSGDHYAILGALHNLHCLKTLREYLIPEYYPITYERFKPEPGETIGVHIDHCIDILRQSSMCAADLTLLPLEWWEGNPVPQNVIHAPHQCVNWEKLQDWAVEHSFDPHTNGILPHNLGHVHPQ